MRSSAPTRASNTSREKRIEERILIKREKKGFIQRGENRERVILASLFTSLCVRLVPRISTRSGQISGNKMKSVIK